MATVEERVINVHWEGPFPLQGKERRTEEGHVIYQLYGSHHLYGRNVLLYIGITKRGNVSPRLAEHRWTSEEYDQMTVYLGSIGEFSTWKEWEEDKEETYEMADEETIKKVESLLIHAHQPVYNQRSKMGQLFPEVSYRYFVDDL
jgi:hypothetical protein